jgi:hypothetical protein
MDCYGQIRTTVGCTIPLLIKELKDDPTGTLLQEFVTKDL